MQRLRKLIRKLQRNAEDYGLPTAISRILLGVFRPVVQGLVFRAYRIDLQQAPRPPEGSGNAFDFRLLSPADADAIRQIENVAEWLAGTVGEKLREGSLCMVAMDGKRVVGFNLVSFGRIEIPLIRLKRFLRPDCAWSEHIATHRDFRRRRIAERIRYRVFDELRRRGIRRFYGGARRSNTASLRLARRVGFEEFVDIHYLRVLVWRTWRFARLRPCRREQP